ncbi:cilia- and flagella-associated protein 74-like [Engraulis encrasicolus]|uniref:cilia- and flagella-associated protein 74-like n=1 Tax=Engraulis encrasicolus TaxID=184585 RepID=UPI002FCF115C
MTSSVLDLTGPFMLLNALRPLRPRHTHTLLIAFTPTQQRQYREVLELHSSRMSLRLTLCGEGVEPMVTCSHSGPIMDFGHLLENDTTTQVIKLYNGSVLPVKFSVLLATPPDSPQPPVSQSEDTQSTDLSSHTTERPTGVFAVCPDEAVIPPGKSADVNVTFQPQHTHTYTQGLTIQLSNKQTVCAADLRGVAQKNNLHLSGVDQGPTHTDDKSVLVILRSDGGAVSRSLELACIRTSQPVAKKNVEFVWEGSAALKGSGFSVDPPKGSVEAGGRKSLNITYTPPKGHTQDMVEVVTPLTLKGHETEIYNVTLQAFPPR